MKIRLCLFGPLLLPITALLSIEAQAVTYLKADNTSSLVAAASYTANSGSPTSAADFVQFDANYGTAAIGNTGPLTLGGFIFTGTGLGGATSTINFGSSSTSTWNVGSSTNTTLQTLIDMSAAGRDVNINNGNGFFRLTGGSGSTIQPVSWRSATTETRRARRCGA